LVEDKILVLLNFSSDTVTLNIADLGGINMQQAQVLLNNLTELNIADGQVTLAPYQAVLMR